MVQRIEHFGAELQVESFSQVEPFADTQIQIPVTRSFKDVAAGAIRSRRRYCEAGVVFENDRANHSRDFLQSRLRFRSDDIRSRFMRKIRGADATAHGEGLSGLKRVDSVDTPPTDHLIQRRLNPG